MEKSIEKVKRTFGNLEKLYKEDKDFSGLLNLESGQVYANSEVHMSEIEIVGFDYDYTIANYSDKALEMTYNEGRNFLVKQMCYPKEILSFKIDHSFSIRGLHYDTKTGLLLKLNQFSKIQYGTAYHGKRQLSFDEVEKLFPGRRISDVYAGKHLKMISDLFAIPIANLISDTIDYFTRNKISFNPNYLYCDLTKAFDTVHLDKIHKNINGSFGTYIEPSEKLIEYIKTLLRSNKKLFMLTNNCFDYINPSCIKIFESIVKDESFGISNWIEIFDVVIMRARKPGWYDSEMPFRVFDVEKSSLSINAVQNFKRGEVYYGGSFKEFEKITGYAMSKVLYMGDNIYNDLKHPRKFCQWRTVAIIRELDNEINLMNQNLFKKINTTLSLAKRLFGKILKLKKENRGKVIPELNETVKRLKLLINEHYGLKKCAMNKQFGSVFRTTNSASKFFYNVQRYADLYTSHVENFANYPLDTAYYVNTGYFVHEADLNFYYMKLKKMLMNKSRK